MPERSALCLDCSDLSRRDFLKGVGGTAVAVTAGAAPLFATPRAVAAAPTGTPESLVKTLYGTMTEAQKKAVCFGWDHRLRQAISNNWSIVPQTIGSFYTPDQQEMIRAIFNGSHSSEEWVKLRLKQMKDDSPKGGFSDYSIALFGTPETKMEFVLTGRHLTMRVDGDAEPGIAFGGPIFYGHAASSFNEKSDHSGNVYWYQAVRANEVFKALSGKQREKALIAKGEPGDDPNTLVNFGQEHRPGLRVEEMSGDQRELVGKVLEDLLAPCRKADAEEARRYIEANGGVKSLNMAFYKEADLGNDGVWDVWRLEGPAMVWYFRGAPHVHTWVRIGEKPQTVAPPSP